jgi:hypothetical protein
MTAHAWRAPLRGGVALLPPGAPGGGNPLPSAQIARAGAVGGLRAAAVPPPAGPGLLVAGTLALVGALRVRRRVSLAR